MAHLGMAEEEAATLGHDEGAHRRGQDHCIVEAQPAGCFPGHSIDCRADHSAIEYQQNREITAQGNSPSIASSQVGVRGRRYAEFPSGLG